MARTFATKKRERKGTKRRQEKNTLTRSLEAITHDQNKLKAHASELHLDQREKSVAKSHEHFSMVFCRSLIFFVRFVLRYLFAFVLKRYAFGMGFVSLVKYNTRKLSSF